MSDFELDELSEPTINVTIRNKGWKKEEIGSKTIADKAKHPLHKQNKVKGCYSEIEIEIGWSLPNCAWITPFEDGI